MLVKSTDAAERAAPNVTAGVESTVHVTIAGCAAIARDWQKRAIKARCAIRTAPCRCIRTLDDLEYAIAPGREIASLLALNRWNNAVDGDVRDWATF
jgi:hypothetical protein